MGVAGRATWVGPRATGAMRVTGPEHCMPSISPRTGHAVRHFLLDGTLAGLLSTAVLAWRGRHDDGSAAAAINAPSHWVWGREALRQDGIDARHTLLGQAVHHGSGLLWAGVYSWMQSRRRPSVARVIGDAAVVTAMAALVDLKLTPERFTPGFERRLTNRSLWMVYGSFGVGLAMGGLSALRREGKLRGLRGTRRRLPFG